MRQTGWQPRHHRFARHSRPAENTAKPQFGDEFGKDRRGVLLFAQSGSIVLDARAAIDAVLDQAELSMARLREVSPGYPVACHLFDTAWHAVDNDPLHCQECAAPAACVCQA
jgi:hypothetical protein